MCRLEGTRGKNSQRNKSKFMQDMVATQHMKAFMIADQVAGTLEVESAPNERYTATFSTLKQRRSVET